MLKQFIVIAINVVTFQTFSDNSTGNTTHQLLRNVLLLLLDAQCHRAIAVIKMLTVIGWHTDDVLP